MKSYISTATSMKSKHFLNQTVSSVFIVVGAIVISAITFNYAGKIDLKLGADGIQVQVDGGVKTP
jgi:small neutral amino acid transporter SnatA (MarC family)